MLMPRSRRNPPRRGVVVVFVAISLIAVVGFVAVAVDGGVLLTQRRNVQNAADSAAMAAACVLYQKYPTYSGSDSDGSAAQAALDQASANGFTNDKTNSTVTVNIPPKSGPYKGLASYVEVIITWQQQRGFSRIFGSDTIPVQARSVARGAWTGGQFGVLVLDYTGKASLNAQGNGAFTETGGPVIINSNNSDAVVNSGNGTLKAQSFFITGSATTNGGTSYLVTEPVANQVFEGVHPTPDPLAYLPVPSVPPNGTMTKTSLGGGNFQYTLTPGRYTSLPTFNTGDVVVLKQASANSAGGVYYIDGGGFKSTGATITMDPLTTGGVMIYNKPASSATSEQINIVGNSAGVVTLSPLTSGPYTGMMFWQDRTSSVPVSISGNGSFTVKGTFYAAGALLQVTGNGGTYTGDDGLAHTGSQIGSQYVSDDLSIAGNGNVYIKYNGPDPAKVRVITLVE